MPRFVNSGYIYEMAKLFNAVESTSGETMYLLVMSTTHTHGIIYILVYSLNAIGLLWYSGCRYDPSFLLLGV